MHQCSITMVDIDLDLDGLGDAGVPDTDYGEEETSFINEDSTSEEPWVTPNELPSWARDGVPSGLDKQNVADYQSRKELVERWRKELGVTEATPSEFVASSKGDLWVRQGRSWLLLTHKNRPGTFLARSTLAKYGADVMRALGIHERSRLSKKNSCKNCHHRARAGGAPQLQLIPLR
jgi:hypothetical protein